MLAATTPLKWPDDGEIDIMEHVGFDQGRIHGTVHCKKYNHTIFPLKLFFLPVFCGLGACGGPAKKNFLQKLILKKKRLNQ